MRAGCWPCVVVVWWWCVVVASWGTAAALSYRRQLALTWSPSPCLADALMPPSCLPAASLGGGRFWNMGEVNQGRKVLHIYCDDLLERCVAAVFVVWPSERGDWVSMPMCWQLCEVRCQLPSAQC